MVYFNGVAHHGKTLRSSIEITMKKIICIEGPDNIGKTTLCKELSTALNAKLFHLGAPKEKGKLAFKEQLATLGDVLLRVANTDGDEVWDRSVIGESVYGPLFREYDHEMYWFALQNLVKHGMQILFIVMYADQQTHEQWSTTSKDDERELYQMKSHAMIVARKFIDVATKLDLPNTIYINCNNYASMDERNEYVRKRVRRWVAGKGFEYSRTHSYRESFFNRTQRMWVEGHGFQENRYQCSMFDERQCSIGNQHKQLKVVGGKYAYPIGAVGAYHNVKYIFIGESSGYQPDREQLIIPMYNGVSGCVFQRALDVCNIHPTQYYLTNIVKCNPKGNRLREHTTTKGVEQFECTQRLAKEIDNVKRANKEAKVIAIGKVASETLTRIKQEHRMIYHPSYYARIGESWRFSLDLIKLM